MSSEGERLQKLLARAGAAPSRRKAEALIEAGRVTVDGRVAQLGERAPAGADVRLDGRPVVRAGGRTVLLLHKPRGVVSTARDPQGRSTVLSLVPDLPGLHPVGRLDRDSEGLLLLTDDGELTLRLTHPRYEHRKRYRVWCREGALAPAAAARLSRGVRLEDGPARADQVEPAPGGCRIELHEGRKRQVRRMLAAVGYHVERLLRTHVAGLALGDLPPGAWREASDEERAALGYAPDTSPPVRRAPEDPMTDTVFTRGQGSVQIDAERIQARVAELAREIERDHRGADLHLVCVLNGAFMFMADLVRTIDAPLTVDFLSVSSYGSRTASSGEVRLVKDLDQSLKGKHVVLVEDIVDTGLTMRYLLGYLEGRGPSSVKVASLLSKPSRRLVDVPVDYLGFEIDDAFVYGYGLDVAHRYRNLPYVTSMSQAEAEALGE